MRKYGTLRERELVPPDDPVTLAESLETRVGALPAGNDPLEQARRAVGVLGLVHWDRGAQRYAAGPRRN